MERLEQWPQEDLNAWEAGCRADDARNAFVLPYLRDLLRGRQVATLLDLGCGTGYVARSLAADLNSGVRGWTLLDHDPAALAYAREHWPPGARANFLECDITTLAGPAGERADLIVICYSILEFSSLRRAFLGLDHLRTDDATAVIFMPDCIEDVLSALVTDRSALSAFIQGDCELRKPNPFLGRQLPFFAHRIENVLERMQETGWWLRRFASFTSVGGKRHYCLEFGSTPAD